MRVNTKRLGLSLLGGILIQFVFILLGSVMGSPMLALIMLLPGWAFGCAGRDSDHSLGGAITCWLVMLAINTLLYAPLIYAVKWWRPFRRKEILSIRAE